MRAAHWQDLALHREFLKRNPYPGGGAPPPAIAQLLAMRTGLEAGSSLAA
ncbi:MAG TPA: hypothetical protein VFH92_04015 [Phenylobacterium sp.]|nr:hypothetical protein [Phenylobacterium sp.]